ncbi:tRNA lysidine(34) synthetase TilS [Luteimonas sp. e5]
MSAPLPATFPLPPDTADPGRRYLLGYSGGLDSSVLLHALAALARGRLRAIHVHHGLQAGADAWAAHCAGECAALGVPLLTERVQVHDEGHGPEAAAREARHAAFARHLRPGEILVLAHHQDDQAETFLLRALRGAGPDGLAAMRPWREYAAGALWRPLLDTPRDALLAHARAHGLRWIEDPSNASADFDRNWLRLELMPRLRQRWPHAAAGLARAAALQAEAVQLLQQDEREHALPADADHVALEALRAVPRPRRARLLREWLQARGLPPLPAEGVRWLEQELTRPPSDGASRLHWAGTQLLRWRDALYLDPGVAALPHGFHCEWDGRAPLHLPNGLLWRLHGASAFDAPLQVRARRGDERIRLPNRSHHHRLKHALQAAGVPPWWRAAWPLLQDADGTLLAAGRLHSAALATWLQQRGAWLELADTRPEPDTAMIDPSPGAPHT